MTKKIDDAIGEGHNPGRRQSMELGQNAAPHGTSLPKCGAKTRAGGVCKKTAGTGTEHFGGGRCSSHGGSSPSGREAGHRELVLAEARRLAPGLEVDEDPGQVLLSELRTARALVRHWEHQLASGRAQFHTTAFGGERKPSVEATFFNRERDRAVEIATVCLKLGLEERRVKIAEEIGDAMFASISAFAEASAVSLLTPAGRMAFDAAIRAWDEALGAKVGRGLQEFENHLADQ